jgi:hypothetical protein
MNEMNSLENQLGSWKPRRPSAKINRRLFPAPRVRSEAVRVLNWLAPATACLLLVLAAYRQENGMLARPPRHDPAVAMMMSNQNTVAYLANGPSQTEQNIWASTFEFTNRSGSSLNSGFTPFSETNQ